jgi:hypothetical protein
LRNTAGAQLNQKFDWKYHRTPRGHEVESEKNAPETGATKTPRLLATCAVAAKKKEAGNFFFMYL